MRDFRSIQSTHQLERAFLKRVSIFGYDNAVAACLGRWGLDGAVIIDLPRAAVDHYVHQRCAGHDPVLRHMINCNQPFFWSDVIEDEPNAERLDAERNFISTMEALGVCEGLSVPLPPFKAQRSFMSLSSRQPVDRTPSIVPRLVLVCAQFWERWLELEDLHGSKRRIVFPPPRLTARQLKCLDFCRRGYSSQQIGLMLDVCENTVQFHISNAMQALGVSNRIHAVARAIELKLLVPIDGVDGPHLGAEKT